MAATAPGVVSAQCTARAKCPGKTRCSTAPGPGGLDIGSRRMEGGSDRVHVIRSYPGYVDLVVFSPIENHLDARETRLHVERVTRDLRAGTGLGATDRTRSGPLRVGRFGVSDSCINPGEIFDGRSASPFGLQRRPSGGATGGRTASPTPHFAALQLADGSRSKDERRRPDGQRRLGVDAATPQ